jgi:hypothetical protein
VWTERFTSGGEEAFGVEDFGNGLARAIKHDPNADAEFANAGLDARVEERDGKKGLVAVGEGANLLEHLPSPRLAQGRFDGDDLTLDEKNRNNYFCN